MRSRYAPHDTWAPRSTLESLVSITSSPVGRTLLVNWKGALTRGCLEEAKQVLQAQCPRTVHGNTRVPLRFVLRTSQ